MVHGKYSSHLLPACSVAWAQLALEGFAWTVGQRQGGYLAQSIQLSRRTQGWGSWITGPASRTLSISVVNSFGGNFVRLYISTHATLSS